MFTAGGCCPDKTLLSSASAESIREHRRSSEMGVLEAHLSSSLFKVPVMPRPNSSCGVASLALPRLLSAPGEAALRSPHAHPCVAELLYSTPYPPFRTYNHVPDQCPPGLVYSARRRDTNRLPNKLISPFRHFTECCAQIRIAQRCILLLV